MKKESGQVMLVAVAIGLVLLIAVTVIVFMNQTGTRHQSKSAIGLKGQSVASEGLSYAVQELSASFATWQNALYGSFPADFNSDSDLSTTSGNKFRLYCSTGTAHLRTLEDYQVAVTVVALGPAGSKDSEVPSRAILAVLSQRTLGADLSTNIHVQAALQMVRQPIVQASSSLNVHWGPIVCLDSSRDATNVPSVWLVPSPIDAGQYPRKFSVGGITGTAVSRAGPAPGNGPSSDQKEYWAYASIAPPPVIDEATYIQMAQMELAVIPAPTSKVSGGTALVPTCTGTNPACGYFHLTPGDTAIFGGGYALTGGPVIYVDGSAEFDSITMDSATVIVTGGLSINDSSGGHSINHIHVPASASMEYPYSPTSQPCQGQTTCTSTDLFSGNVQFRGFLYVKGNIFVNTLGWNMLGTLMVGDMQAPQGTSGTLVIPGKSSVANASLNLAYDDEINHSILVNPVSLDGQIKIEPDFLQDVPVF